MQVAVDVLNLFDRKVDDIEYLYQSCLAGEVGVVPACSAPAPAGVADIHLHPAEPRTVRLSLKVLF